MKSIPTVKDYMTYVPQSIGFDQPLSKAQQYMREFHIRHLPVLNNGQLVGIVSDRDINLVLTFKDATPEKITVEETYTADPYFTTPEAPLNEVTAAMAKNKYGCVIVVDHGKLIGIFTEIDAYKVLSKLLNNQVTE